MRIRCKTFFDVNATGVTGHYKQSRIPFVDNSNQQINNEISWNIARNQQRNWETITQVIGLRAQIAKLDKPARNMDFWEFEFEVDTPDVFGDENNPVELLYSDAHAVPMLLNLWNKTDLEPVLISYGDRQNIWFTIV
jgi:hypothetical protein